MNTLNLSGSRLAARSARNWFLHAFLTCLILGATFPGQGAEKTRLLILSGSHRFETNQFFQVFKDNADVMFEAAAHPAAHERLRPESAKNFDVLVLYDYWQKITEEAKADFVNFLKAGKGLLILHHAVADYQQWPEYGKILGGRYYLQPTLVNGVEKPRSRAKEGLIIPVHIADPDHPITRGLKDFEIRDEVYGGYDIAPESHVLLTTTLSNNAPYLAWVKTYEAARVVYLQLGHDHFAYEDPNYRRLLAQAIRWVARRE
jgi:type 1 glutamine amidotransferase